MTSSISVDVLGIIALCFTINLAIRNIVIDNYKTKIYISAAAVTITILVLEILTILLQGVNSSKLVIFNKIANILGFSLSPLVPYILLLFNKKNKYSSSGFLIIPLLFNAIICILSYRTGWVFYINNQNQYMRGNFFLISTIISMLYYLLLIASIVTQDFKYDIDDKIYLILVFLMPSLATFIQIIFNKVLLIWGSVSLSLLLYYVFLRELQFKYDTVSEIKNRAAFEKKLEQHQKNDISAAIIVFDLNNFKKINDKHGHKSGDDAILYAAKILKECFDGIGEPYRIGGDEFCVICNNVTNNQIIDDALLKLEHLSNMIKQDCNIKIAFAYGYDFYIKSENKSIYETFYKADKSMYEHKAKLKGLYGRRKDDN